jgi:dethiobiotin synthetase
VIAPDRLGSLNHILLTLEVLQAASVPVLGVVVNAPAAPDRATGTNVAALRRVGGIDRIASLSRLGAIEEAASHLGEVAGWLTP